MQSTTPHRTPSRTSLDDHLGPAESRFFGSGYRRVTYRLDHLETADAGLQARIAIGYPVDWSTKASKRALAPHLSTVDALLLGARTGALALAGAPGLTAEGRRSAWLRRVDIKAASTPWESGLDALPVSATRGATSLETTTAATTTVDSQVGSMRVRLQFAHPVGDGPTERPTVEQLADETRRGPYGDAFALQRQRVDDLALDLAASRARATVDVVPLDDHGSIPAVTMVDSFVVALQLGQVLLYQLDGVERGRSSNLWMRSATLSADAPCAPAAGPVPVTAELADARLINKGGALWRTASVVGELAGVRTRCAVAHQLPEPAAGVLAA